MKTTEPKPPNPPSAGFFSPVENIKDEIMQTPDKEKAASGVQPRAASTSHSIHQFTMYLGIKKLKGRGIVHTAARHNLRANQAEFGADSHIDASRIKDNYIINGADTAAGVADYERDLLAYAEFPYALRKDAVKAVELVVSLPPDSEIDHREYFAAAVGWARKRFNAPILSAVVHLDESAPHCHILLLPLVDGRMVGGRMVGNHSRFMETLTDFYEKVAKLYGLARQTPQKRLSADVRHDLGSKVLARLKFSHGLLNEPNIKDALLSLLCANPATIAAAMGIDIPQPNKPKAPSFAGIMTKPQKPEKPPISKDFDRHKSKDFGQTAPQEKDRSLTCEDFRFPPPVIPPAEPEQTTYQRIHEDEQDARYWDTDTGQHIQPPVRQRTTSPAIEQTSAQIISLQARRQA